jgi:hypothetical protein
MFIKLQQDKNAAANHLQHEEAKPRIQRRYLGREGAYENKSL